MENRAELTTLMSARPGVEIVTVADVVARLFERPAWQADALCREHPEINFFPIRGENNRPAKLIRRAAA